MRTLKGEGWRAAPCVRSRETAASRNVVFSVLATSHAHYTHVDLSKNVARLFFDKPGFVLLAEGPYLLLILQIIQTIGASAQVRRREVRVFPGKLGECLPDAVAHPGVGKVGEFF